MEKNYLHHNVPPVLPQRFVLEVITDRSKEQAKKKFSEILRFSEEVPFSSYRSAKGWA